MYLSRRSTVLAVHPSDDRRRPVDRATWRDEERFMGDSPVPRRPGSASRAGIPLLGTEFPFDLDLTRRDVLKIGGYTSLAAFLAACSTGGGGGGTAGPGTVTVGSNQSDTSATGGPRKGMAHVTAAFEKATGNKVKLNTVDHGTFQDQISSYLQGTPEDSFTWFSGHRMRFFAAQGLASPVDETWDKVKGNFTPAFAEAVKSSDGHVYGIPVDYYPWAVFYRKSVWAQHGYKIPTTWDDFKALAAQMKKDGLVPIA